MHEQIGLRVAEVEVRMFLFVDFSTEEVGTVFRPSQAHLVRELVTVISVAKDEGTIPSSSNPRSGTAASVHGRPDIQGDGDRSFRRAYLARPRAIWCSIGAVL